MPNEITPFANTLSIDAFTDQIKEFEKTAPKVQPGGVPLLRMLKQDGSWVYGQQSTEVEDYSTWAIDPSSLAQGFIAFHAGRPEGERMALMGQPAVDPSTLDPVQAKDGWQEQVGFGLVCMSGEDEGTAVMYKTVTMGGTEAFNVIFDAIKARALAKKPYTPMVSLGHDSYVHSEYGKIFKPIFNIVGWLGDEEEAPAIEEEAPKRRRRKA